MVTGSTKPSAGVTAAAVVAILGSLVSIFFAAVMALSGAAMRMPTDRPLNQPLPSVGVIAIMAIVYFACGAWGVSSAIGLLRLKNWARLCFLIFGGLLAFFSLSAAAGSLIVVLPGATPPAPNLTPAVLRGVAAVFVILSLMGLAIASWWLVYFNRATVKAKFGTGGSARLPRQFPLAITIIAWLLVAGGAINGVQMLLAYPLVLFGIVLRGWASGLALALLAAVSVTAGLGLLKKRAEAHSLAVGYFGFGVLNQVSYLVLPGSFARMHDVIRETQGSQGLPAGAMNPLMIFVMLFGLVFTGVVLLLLIKARKAFIDLCRSAA